MVFFRGDCFLSRIIVYSQDLITTPWRNSIVPWKVGSTLMILLLVPLTALADSPVGRWRTIDDETGKLKSVVEITEQNGELIGKVVEILDPDAATTCVKCDGERKDQPIVGMQILWGLKPAGQEWSGGTIFNPADNGEYRSSVRLIEAGQKLEVKGKWLVFSRTQVWERLE